MKLKCLAENIPFVDHNAYRKHCDDLDLDYSEWYLDYAEEANALIDLKNFIFYDDDDESPSTGGHGVRLIVSLKSLDILEFFEFLKMNGEDNEDAEEAVEEAGMSVILKGCQAYRYQNFGCPDRGGDIHYQWLVTICNKVFNVEYTSDDASCEGHYIICNIKEIESS